MHAITSTSVVAAWQLPPADSRNGIIAGFKLLYKTKGSADSPTMLPIDDGSILIKFITGLEKFRQYEFQVLAFTSAGDGPTSAVEVERTKQDGKGLESARDIELKAFMRI